MTPSEAEVIVRARVVAPDGRTPIPDGAVAAAGGRILAVGRAGDIAGLGTPKTKRYELDGLLLPGFFDSHNHMMMTGLGMLAPSLDSCKSIREALDVIGAWVRDLGPGEWVITSPAWHETNLAEQRFPTAAELDAVSDGHPVVVRRGGHNVVLNTRAQEMLEVMRGYADVPGTTVVRDAEGNLTGHVTGSAFISRLLAELPATTEETRRRALETVSRAYSAAGITSLVEPGLDPTEIELYRALGQEGSLGIRVRMLWRPARSDDEIAEAVSLLRSTRSLSRFRDEWTSLFGLKLTADGGVETGFYREPYAHPDDPTHPRGKPVLSGEAMAAVCEAAAEAGWCMGIHCVGDAAIDEVLTAFEAANQRTPIADRRWALIHMMYARRDHWPRVRALGACVTAQQPLQYALSAGFHHYIGPDRARDIEPLRAYLDETESPVGGGSDSPVAPFDPLTGIRSSVTRMTRSAGIVGPDWAISLPEAIEMYTSASAWSAFEEDSSGSLAPGKFMDLTCLSDDVLAEPDRLSDTRVLWTMAGGKVTHGG